MNYNKAAFDNPQRALTSKTMEVKRLEIQYETLEGKIEALKKKLIASGVGACYIEQDGPEGTYQVFPLGQYISKNVKRLTHRESGFPCPQVKDGFEQYIKYIKEDEEKAKANADALEEENEELKRERRSLERKLEELTEEDSPKKDVKKRTRRPKPGKGTWEESESAATTQKEGGDS